MKFVNQLSASETLTLRDLHKNSSIHRLRERGLIILMSSAGFMINDIGLALDLDRDTISGAMDAWEDTGLAGLYDAKKSGRPTIFTDKEEEEILIVVSKKPRNLKAIIAEVETTTGKKASKDTIKRTIKKKGFIWKRIRKVTPQSPDPQEYKEKQEKLNNLKARALSGEIYLHFSDESGFSLIPVVPYAWQQSGQQITVPSQRSKSINVLGFLQYPNTLKSIVWEGSINSECVIKRLFRKRCG